MNIRDIKKMTPARAKSILRKGEWYRAWYGRVQHFFASPYMKRTAFRTSRTLCNKDLFVHVVGTRQKKCLQCERRYQLIEEQVEVGDEG